MKHSGMRWTLIFCLLINAITLQSINGQDVSMFRGNATLNGVYDDKPVYGLNGVLFTFKTNGPIRSTAAVANGKIFFGSGDENFYALDARTGKEIWHFKTGGAVNSSPAIADGIAYFISRDGNLYGLQTTDGKEVWRFKMGTDLPYENGWDYYLSSPCIADEKLFTGSGDGYLYGFSLKTKKLLWQFNAGTRIRTTPAVAGDKIIFGSMDGYVYALKKDDGSLSWKFALKGASLNFNNYGFDVSGILCSPATGEGIVAIGGRDGNLYAIDLATGKQKWLFDHGGSWVLGTAVHNGNAYAASGSSAFVQCVDIKSGTEKWRFKTSGAVFSSLTLSGDLIYFGDYTGNVYALDNKNGKEQWHFPMGTRSFSTPVISDGIIYCSSDDGILYALSGNTTTLIAKAPAKKAVFWEGFSSDTLYHWFANNFDIYIRDYFKAADYEWVDSNTLKQFMEQRISDKAPSVIVFADNKVPISVIKEKNANALIRKYLNAGGKIVFIGPNPLAFKYNTSSGQVDTVNWNIAERVFGIPFSVRGFRGNSEVYNSHATEDGMKWGLRDWWVGYGSLDLTLATTVLAINEYGYASAWLKNYGGPEGTGLLQLSIPRAYGTDLSTVKIAAEFGITW